MPNLPSGTVAFLFTDIEGSTALWERDRTAMQTTVDRHLALLQTAIETQGGVPFKIVGDAVQAVFATAPAAVAAALDGQRALLADRFPEVGGLRVRMALHAGEAAPDERGDYLAPALNRLDQLLAAGHGGQVLLSPAVRQLAQDALPSAVALQDLGERQLRDLSQPERVYQVLHPDLPDAFPPLRSLEVQPHNLPTQATPFLGREREVAEVVALLRSPQTRLVTLTGPGGTGKTRLALQAGVELLDTFPDGVFFVPLASLADPVLVPSSVAQALGVPEQGGRPVVDVLRDYLTEKQFLLVLDNCEHLLTAVADLVADLVATCSRLTVLATSRPPSGCVPSGSGKYRHWRCRSGHRRHPLPSSSRPTLRFASSSIGHGLYGLTSWLTTRALLRWPRSAGVSTACRWPSSWRRRGCACSRRTRSWLGWRTGCRS